MKKECKKIRPRIFDLVSDELAPGKADAVISHISLCEDCRKEHEEMLELVRSLQAVPARTAPEGLRAGIRNRLVGEKSRKRAAAIAQLWRRPAFAAAMAVILLGIVLLVVLPSGEPPEPAITSVRDAAIVELTFEKYVEFTGDVFHRIAVENQRDLARILGVPPGMMPPGWKPAENILQGAANAMKLKEELDPVEDEFEVELLRDVEYVWKKMYDSRESFSEHIDEIRQLIRDKRILDRLDQAVE